MSPNLLHCAKLSLRMVLYTFAFSLITIPYSLKSQGVGVNSDGTMPANSAILDVKAVDKGMLIPRVSLIDTDDVATISSPDTSLIVHNTNDTMQGGNGKGIYQWNGNKWVKLIAPENGPGTDGDVLTSKGSGLPPVWKTAGSGGGCQNKIQVFDTPGSYTWTHPAGVDLVFVSMVGAGGGGGGGGARAASGGGSSGGGGGGGQAFLRYPVAVSGNIAVAVGAGGAGGAGAAANSDSDGANGGDGGNTSFGTLVASGGKGGSGGSGFNSFSEGRGGNSGGGLRDPHSNTGIHNINALSFGDSFGNPGAPGADGRDNASDYPTAWQCGAFAGGDNSNFYQGGGGGASSFGAGGDGGTGNGAGTNGSNGSGYGSGGGAGGGGNNTNAGGTGGNGTAGYIIVIWSE